MAPTTPIKADELAALTAATSVCCADIAAEFVAKKRQGVHPSRSQPEAKEVISCYQSVKEGLLGGACADAYKEHLACVEQVGWRESPKECKISRVQVQECSVREGLGELKNA